MFRITRGISLDHSPAFPNPSFRFPSAAAIAIHGDDHVPAADPWPAQPTEASMDADPPAPGLGNESPSAAPS